mmetsp:Transcript_118629/g.383024  ORF Transcript_118629/g.383024 Transcript_118629/m.383024 type:complete len:208 (-) Transcript_118629:175-798(-)
MRLARGACFAAAALAAAAAQTVDPCQGVAEVERCHYERALQQLNQALHTPVQQGLPDRLSTVQLSLQDPRPCPPYLSAAECEQGRQVAALRAALEALEGQPPVPAGLDPVIGDLEAAMDATEPHSVADFRRSRLAAAFNAAQPPLPSAERAAVAVMALESIRWPADSLVPTSMEVLRGLARPSRGAPQTSFLARVSSAVHRWLPWNR